MDKHLLYGLMILFIIPLSLAITGGEQITYHFDTCDYYTVTITNTTLGEWTTKDCTETTAGVFKNCPCTNNYDVKLTPAVNSVGNFSITISSYYYKSGGGGGGGGGGGYTPSSPNKTIIKEQEVKQLINATLITTECPTCPTCPICTACEERVNCSTNVTQLRKGYILEPFWLFIARWFIVLLCGAMAIYFMARSNYWI